jgi:hypothetical protein
MEESSKPSLSPAIDVVAPPKAEAKPADLDVKEPPKDQTELKKPAPKEVVKDKSKKPDTPKQPSGGSGGAIFATVVIVFGLAAMATYAYIQTLK